MRRQIVVALLGWVSLTAVAHAQTPPARRETPRGCLALVVRDSGADAGVTWQDVVRHVEGELTARGVAACSDDESAFGARAPLAFGWLELEATTPERVRIALRFADGATGAAERALELGQVPADARALSIAIAADELLAANWAGVERRAARRAPQPKQPEIPTPPRAPEPARFELGPSFAFEAFAGGQRLLGADVRFGWRLWAPLALTLRGGVRQGLPETAPHGSVHSFALLGGFGLRCDLLQSTALTLRILARADALRVAASAYPTAGAVAHEANGVALVLSGGPELELQLSRSLRLQLDATGGGAARPVHVTDSGERVSGISGWAMSVAGGVSVAF